jgi:hypothetical protein
MTTWEALLSQIQNELEYANSQLAHQREIYQNVLALQSRCQDSFDDFVSLMQKQIGSGYIPKEYMSEVAKCSPSE